MLLWFIVLGLLGLRGLLEAPGVLAAISPHYAVAYILQIGPATALAVLAAVFLAVTGGEALYADMGHFGRFPIRAAWFAIVLPGLVLNYFGQGALLLTDPAALKNPFYELAPDWGHYPLIVLATMATFIASQAVITGSFSLTQQAIHLGFLPRMHIVHTAGEERGQIYIPIVNWGLAVLTVGAVVGFGSSSRLAGAYGLAVSKMAAPKMAAPDDGRAQLGPGVRDEPGALQGRVRARHARSCGRRSSRGELFLRGGVQKFRARRPPPNEFSSYEGPSSVCTCFKCSSSVGSICCAKFLSSGLSPSLA